MVPIRLPGFPAFDLHVHAKPDRFISEELCTLGRWEPFETEVIRILLAAGDTFVDLGANLGYYTVIAGLTVGTRGRVFAFEPDLDNFGLLERNVAANRLANVRIERCAISDRLGEARLHLSADNQGDHRLYASEPERASIVTSTQTLDGYFCDAQRFPDGPGELHLVKMDTQGCEALILRGAQRLVSRHPPKAWIVEFWPYGLERAGTSATELLEHLERLVLKLAILREDKNQAEQIDRHELEELARKGLHPETGRFVNLVAIPCADEARWERVIRAGGGLAAPAT